MRDHDFSGRIGPHCGVAQRVSYLTKEPREEGVPARWVCPILDCTDTTGFSRARNVKRHLQRQHGLVLPNSELLTNFDEHNFIAAGGPMNEDALARCQTEWDRRTPPDETNKDKLLRVVRIAQEQIPSPELWPANQGNGISLRSLESHHRASFCRYIVTSPEPRAMIQAKAWVMLKELGQDLPTGAAPNDLPRIFRDAYGRNSPCMSQFALERAANSKRTPASGLNPNYFERTYVFGMLQLSTHIQPPSHTTSAPSSQQTYRCA